MKFDLKQILEYFNNLNDQARYAILGGVVVVIILLDVFLLVLPQCAGIAELNSQVTKMAQDTQQILVDRQRVGQLRRNLQLTRLELKELSNKVRPVQEVPIILANISSIANQYDVKIDQLIPEKQLQEALTVSPEGRYYALPVVIKARCGYHMFGRFLNKLEMGTCILL
jgi:Tfp pilus assembly protein PilO